MKKKEKYIIYVHQEYLHGLYLYTLESKGMTEHGCSVHFSWLNDKGRALMKVVKAAVRTKLNNINH